MSAGVVAPSAVRNVSRGRGFVRWLLMRLLLGVVTLFGVSIVVFLATQALPGDVAGIILGTHATPETLATLREQLGLNLPLWQQYGDWLVGVLSGNLGDSLVSGQPVSDILGQRILNSATLGVLAMACTIPLSLLLGVWAAYRRDRFVDKVFMGSSMIVNALPDFVLGTILVALFGTVVFHILPPVSIIPPGDLPWWHPVALILPVAVPTLFGTTYLSRLIRAQFIDVMESEYVQTAILKGLSMRRVLFRHAVPNAIAPSIPAASVVAAYTLATLVVVEYLFAYPGIGAQLISSVDSHDLPMIQAIVLFMAAVFYLLNLLADILSTLNQPKVRS